MPTRILQNKFNQGEFSPEMLGRSDVDQYYGAAETLTNVVVLPQGGVMRRDGLGFIDTAAESAGNLTPTLITATNGGTTANADDFDSTTVLLTTNNISTTNPYVVLEYDLGADVQIEEVHLSNIFLTVSGTSTGDFTIETATAAAPTTWIPQGGIVPAIELTTEPTAHIWFVDKTMRYIRLVKVTGTDLGANRLSLTEMNVYNNVLSDTETRLMPFEFNKEQTYQVVFSDNLINIYQNNALLFGGASKVATLPAPEFTSDKLDEINWTQSADTAIVVHKDIAPHKLVRGASNADWVFTPIVFDNKPVFDFVPTSSNPAGTITPSAKTGVITLTASSAIFTDSATDVHQIIDGGGGRARIVEFLTTTTVKAVVLIPFFDTTTIVNLAWVFETGFEDAWATARGWPNSTTFHDGRLWFGGSRELPQTLWASKVGLFFDFDRGQVFDDDAINVTLDTDQVNEIVNLFSQRTLQVFTSGGEFAVQQFSGIAITPTTIDIRRQTQEGSQKGVRPSVIDGSTIYLKREGSAVLEFLFSDVEQAFSSQQLTVASSHLIITPVDMAVERSDADNEASLLYIVNSDGTMAVGSILKGQNVLAFTRFTTTAGSGKFKNVSVDSFGVTVVVERTLGNGTERYIERFQSGNLLDSSSFGQDISPTTVSGNTATRNKNQTVHQEVDGVWTEPTADSNGVLVFDPIATDSFNVGYDFDVVIKDLPVEVAANAVRIQSSVGKKKRISKVTLRLKDAGNVLLNGSTVTTPNYTVTGGNTTIADFTGLVRIEGILDYDETGQITITQDEPRLMTLLVIAKEVNF